MLTIFLFKGIFNHNQSDMATASTIENNSEVMFLELRIEDLQKQIDKNGSNSIIDSMISILESEIVSIKQKQIS